MENIDFEAFKRQTAERLTTRYDKYITKLKKMLGKARRLERDFRGDYRGYVAIECGNECDDANQSFTPIQVAQFLIRDIRALIPLVKQARNNAERDIMETEDHNDLEVAEAWLGKQLANYSWDIRNLKEPLQAFKHGYGSGVEAYIMSRQAWQVRYQ